MNQLFVPRIASRIFRTFNILAVKIQTNKITSLHFRARKTVSICYRDSRPLYWKTFSNPRASQKRLPTNLYNAFQIKIANVYFSNINIDKHGFSKFQIKLTNTVGLTFTGRISSYPINSKIGHTKWFATFVNLAGVLGLHWTRFVQDLVADRSIKGDTAG